MSRPPKFLLGTRRTIWSRGAHPNESRYGKGRELPSWFAAGLLCPRIRRLPGPLPLFVGFLDSSVLVMSVPQCGLQGAFNNRSALPLAPCTSGRPRPKISWWLKAMLASAEWESPQDKLEHEGLLLQVSSASVKIVFSMEVAHILSQTRS